MIKDLHFSVQLGGNHFPVTRSWGGEMLSAQGDNFAILHTWYRANHPTPGTARTSAATATGSSTPAATALPEDGEEQVGGKVGSSGG